jgi:hypothetical protein
MLSDSGEPEAVLSNADLHLTADGDRLEIHHFTILVNKLRLHADGALVLDDPLEFSFHETHSGNFLKNYLKHLREIARHTRHLANLENPSLHIRFQADPADIALATATLHTDTLVNPPGVPFPLFATGLVSTTTLPLRQAAVGALVRVTTRAETMEISAAADKLPTARVPTVRGGQVWGRQVWGGQASRLSTEGVPPSAQPAAAKLPSNISSQTLQGARRPLSAGETPALPRPLQPAADNLPPPAAAPAQK